MPFMKLKGHCNVRKRLPLGLMLRQLNPAHVLQFNIILTGVPIFQKFLLLRVLLLMNDTIFTASCGRA